MGLEPRIINIPLVHTKEVIHMYNLFGPYVDLPRKNIFISDFLLIIQESASELTDQNVRWYQ